MDYKKTYSNEEISDLLSWLKENKNRMPETLQLNDAIFIPDLQKTLEAYMVITEKHYQNVTYGAQIHHLFLIREKLTNDNLLLPE